MNDKKCVSCGHDLTENCNFCPNCGLKAEPLTYKCKCGKMCPVASNFCSGCGENKPSETSTLQPTQAVKKEVVEGGGEEECVTETPLTENQSEAHEKSGVQESRLLNDQMTDRGDRMASTRVDHENTSRVTGDENTGIISGDCNTSSITDGGNTSTVTGAEGQMNSMTGGNDHVTSTMTGRVDHTVKGGVDHVTSRAVRGDHVTTTLSDKNNQMLCIEQSGVTDKIDQQAEPNTDTEEGMGGGMPAGSKTEDGGNLVPKILTSETAQSDRQNRGVAAGQKLKEESSTEQERRGDAPETLTQDKEVGQQTLTPAEGSTKMEEGTSGMHEHTTIPSTSEIPSTLRPKNSEDDSARTHSEQQDGEMSTDNKQKKKKKKNKKSKKSDDAETSSAKCSNTEKDLKSASEIPSTSTPKDPEDDSTKTQDSAKQQDKEMPTDGKQKEENKKCKKQDDTETSSAKSSKTEKDLKNTSQKEGANNQMEGDNRQSRGHGFGENQGSGVQGGEKGQVSAGQNKSKDNLDTRQRSGVSNISTGQESGGPDLDKGQESGHVSTVQSSGVHNTSTGQGLGTYDIRKGQGSGGHQQNEAQESVGGNKGTEASEHSERLNLPHHPNEGTDVDNILNMPGYNIRRIEQNKLVVSLKGTPSGDGDTKMSDQASGNGKADDRQNHCQASEGNQYKSVFGSDTSGQVSGSDVTRGPKVFGNEEGKEVDLKQANQTNEGTKNSVASGASASSDGNQKLDESKMVAYRKQDTEPEDLFPATNKKAKISKPDDFISDQLPVCHVTFHVVVAPEFKLQSRDRVVIQFQHEHLGGYGCKKHVLVPVRTVDDDKHTYHVMQLFMDLPKPMIHSGHLRYMYGIYREEKLDNEFLYHRPKDASHRSIVPHAKDSNSVPDTWVQSDGMMHPKPEKNILGKVYSYFAGDEYKAFVKYNIIAATLLMPRWQGFTIVDASPDMNILSAIDGVFHVNTTMYPLFVGKGKTTHDKSQFKEALNNFLDEALSRLENHQHKYETLSQEQKVLDILTSLAVIYLMVKFDMISQDVKVSQSLFWAFLVKPDNENRTCPEYSEVLEKHVKGHEKMFQKALVEFCSQMCTFNHHYEPTWLFAVPLIHFLGQESSVFTRLPASVKHKTPHWWGVQSIGKAVGSYKYEMSSGNRMPVQFYLKLLPPMFELDPLLPRTLMAVMSPCHLQEIFNSQLLAPEICLANLWFFLNADRWYPSNQNTISVLVTPLISTLEKQQKAVSRDIIADMDDAKVGAHIAIDFVIHAINRLKRTSSYPIASTAVQVVVSSIDRLAALVAQAAENEAGKADMDLWKKALKVLATSLAEVVADWLDALLPKSMMGIWNYGVGTSYSYVALSDVYELQIFSWLVSVKFQHYKEGNEFWSDWFLGKLRHRLKPVNTKDKVSLFCSVKPEECAAVVVDQISKCVFDDIEGANKNSLSDCSTLLDTVQNPGEAQRLGELFSTMFQKSWPTHHGILSEEGLEIMKHVLEWTSFCRYLRIFYGKDQRSQLLTGTCRELLTLAVFWLKNVSECLLSGNIHINMLNVILDGVANFATVYQTIQENSQVSEEDAKRMTTRITRALQRRKKELDQFHEMRGHLKSLVLFCMDFPVDVKELRSRINKPVDDLELSNVCHTLPVMDEPGEENKPEVQVLYFDQQDDVVSMARQLSRVNKTALFAKIWNSYCKKAYKEKKAVHGDYPLNLQELADLVWIPAHTEITALCNKLRTGRLTLREVDRLFHEYKGSYKQLQSELMSLCEPQQDNSWVNDCVKKVEKYHKMNRYKEGAKKMKTVVEVLCLTGNFKVLDTLLSVDEDKSACLGDISDHVMSAGEELMDVTDEMADCIGEVGKCQDLVAWLKKLNGTKEVKVLVDLAMMSAQGQSDLEVERVQCLSDAAMGYAPLIYELPDNADFPKFLTQCQLVWGTWRTNPDLPQRLRELSRNLQWLENIEKSHGSTETNSLSQVQTINSRGVFKVGYIETLAGNQQNQTLDHVVELVIKPDGNQKEVKTLSLQQLNDLQSRLMLVVGRDERRKSDVDRFVEILDGVTRLGRLYTKLCSAGSIIFRKWRATFYCDPDIKVTADINFGLSDKMLHAPRGISLTKQIMDLCEFLEDCLHQWTEDIHQKRQEFYQLNHFTTEQLVILRSELAKVCSGEQGKPEMYALLHAVKSGCDTQDLRNALQLAVRKLSPNVEEEEGETTEETTESGHQSDNDEGEASSSDNQAEVVMTFVEEMVSAGYSQRLALEALKHVDPSDAQEGMLWCMEHEDTELDEGDEALDLQVPEHPDTEAAGRPDIPDREAVENLDLSSLIIQDTSLDMTKSLLEGLTQPKSSLKQQLQSLWTQHMEQSGASSVSDFLSLQHLGLILEELAGQDEQILDRPFPEGFTTGKPNLVICPQGEVLASVLSLYMYGEGLSLPLPSTCEVLMCNSHTSTEEVDLLLRRCFHCSDNRIFCLVNADLLDYDVSCHTENSYDKLSHRAAKQDFRLVVVCSSEHSDKSSLVTAFDKFRIKNQFVCTAKEIQAYLKDKFTVQSDVMKTVDPESLCVRMIQSHRAGVGKSLKVSRVAEKLEEYEGEEMHISIHKRGVDREKVLQQLLPKTQRPEQHKPHLVHIDIAHEVQEGVDELLFSLLILGRLTAHSGHVWLRSDLDLYVVEVLPLLESVLVGKDKTVKTRHVHTMLQFLPKLTCWAPKDSLFLLQRIQQQAEPGEMFLTTHPDYQHFDQLMDRGQFESESWQRVYQYLKRYQRGLNLDSVNPAQVEGTPADCIETLLRYCGLVDPSWAELRHFVHFLDIQLKDCEQSSFCSVFVAQDLPGFKQFVVKLMIQMSRDFATRSLNISEETPGLVRLDEEVEELQDDQEEGIEQFQMKRTWESSPHPYLFFNSDHHSLTFLGFNIARRTFNLVDAQTNTVLEENVMTRQLYEALVRNHVPLQEDFDKLDRAEKITKLCNVMGNNLPGGYDDTYVLTTDNAKKILAIYMRFRCDIPVIIMGETGCGKTRLVRFLCDLQKPAGAEVENMVLMKVHGGTTEADIQRTLVEATELARKNKQDFPHMYTVLFFDEANTTEEIGLIKQVMCDRLFTRDQADCGLKMVAACNPYRKHSDEMVRRLEAAGLGYHIKAEQTTDKLGHVPLRRLVYRVQALPQSLLPLVWDFGQLDTRTEEMYIQQMVTKFVATAKLPGVFNIAAVVSKIMAASQDYMRQQKDECSFVSLRDVERVLSVMAWFYHHKDVLYSLMDQRAEELFRAEYHAEEEFQNRHPNAVTRSLVLALGVCYQACLQEKRGAYRDHVAQHFIHPLTLLDGANTIEEEINSCQEVFLSHVSLEDNIARNQALKENVFMMVVCIELRIPLFLVGKPGSSKSLAKTIVADAMQGDTSKTDLFKRLKFAHMVSFQCSPLSSPEGIVGMFHQCATLQQKKELDKYVSVVVLDEVGLAEDSPRMPLKTLHPLLEDGCQGNEKPEPYKKVAFIGISNWALDPAKMNRGILVQRGVPDETELVRSARGICSGDRTIKHTMNCFLEPLAKGYLRMYRKAIETESREFFGLRDFYSIVKMVNAFAKRSRSPPTWHELEHSILRNFGGLESVRPLEEFEQEIQDLVTDKEKKNSDPDCSAAGLIRACLFGEGLQDINSQSRYLLILTENYAALKIFEQQLFKLDDAIIIFGSSFPRDQEYTQVCRNINRIKICMETGKTVVLLNLQNLYESLYDALNQYYVYFGGQQFVDLGLGTHRVKCRVHKEFRLIVVAEKQTVYKTFPIPLINRLEKHTLTMETMLSEQQLQLTKQLEHWVKAYIADRPQQVASRHKQLTEGDVFIGYDKDTAASVILQVTEELATRRQQQPQSLDDESEEEYPERINEEEVLDRAKELLLRCATPESVLLVRHTHLKSEERSLADCYFNKQTHDNLAQFLQRHLHRQQETGLFAQITTHSRLLSASDKLSICRVLYLKPASVWLQSLQAFDTEQQFTKMLRDFFHSPSSRLLLLQCDSGDEHATMIASARYNLQQEGGDQSVTGPKHVLLIVQLPRKAGGCFVGFQGGRWLCYHIDDLHPDEGGVPSLSVLQEHSIGDLFTASVNNQDKECNGLLEAFRGLRMDGETARIPEELNQSLIPEEADADDVSLELEGSEEHENTSEDASLHSEEETAQDIASDAHEADVDDKEGRSKTQSLDVDQVIRNCVHGAAAMLEEENVSSQRKTERVSLLLKLMETEGSPEKKSFLSVIKRRVALLLRDKEESVTTATRATSWLTYDAASQQAIVRAGTLRHSVRQHIEAKVTPVLAAVLAYCDADSNLDHMTSATTADWLRDLWLDLLNASNITRLSFKNKVVMLPQSDSNHIQIEQHGYRGYRFKAKVPFSWVIRDLTAELIYNNINTRGFQETSLEDRVSQQFHISPVGQILGQLEPEIHRDLVQRYLHDFVSMRYCPVTDNDQEIQLLCDGVVSAAIDQHLRSSSTDAFHLDFPTIHLVWSDLQPRVELVEQVLMQWPEALREILRFRETQPEHALNTKQEFTLDIQLLTLLLEHLSPQSEKRDGKPWNELDVSIQTRQDWVARVDRFAAIVERIFNHMTRLIGSIDSSNQSQGFVQRSRHLWSRISAVRLLTQYIHAADEGELKIKKCFNMWKFLPEDSDFKKVKILELVENFLKTSNISAYKHYLGSVEKCQRCGELLDEPVLLPCNHKVCSSCIQLFLESNQRNCPQCKAPFPETLNKSGIDAQQQEALDKYQNYKKQCNAFYMAVVSQLCFHGNTPPESDVIQHLLKLITQEAKDTARETRGTKQMVALKDREAVDATPVVRSFLLQMLLRSHYTEVQQHIEEYFLSCRDVLGEAGDAHWMEVVLLFVNCWEDSLPRKHQVVAAGQQVAHLTHLLSQSTSYLTRPGFELTKLMGVATVRYCLSLVATWMVQGIQDTKLLGTTQKVCEGELAYPRLYLLRQLNRYHGVTKLQEVVARIPWLQDSEPQDMRQPDRFLIYGESYQKIREALERFLISGDVDMFSQSLKNIKCLATQQQVLLSVYTEVTLGNQTEDEDQKIHMDIVNKLDTALTEKLKSKDLASELIRNRLAGHNTKMTVMPGEPGLVTIVREMLVHLLVILTTGEDSNLTQPLRLLATKPQQMHQRFLPTMPQDDLVYINQAMQNWLKETKKPNYEKLEVYRCPNGHAYTIGDCGRPYFKGRCNECGSLIGGLSHKLETGNVKVETVADKTVQGHTLGAPAARQKEAIPERKLGPAATSLLRLLTHMAMSLGANRHPEEVVQLIEPPVTVDQVQDFLFDHMTCDLEVLASSLGRSEEDCVLLVNLVIRNIGKDDKKYNKVDGSLQSKESREKWEEKFSTTYLQPVLQNMATELTEAHGKLMEDQRIGQNQFLRQVYEAETLPEFDLDLEHIEEMPALWKLRERVTVEHLLQEVNQKVKGHSQRTLQLFLSQLHKLSGLRLLPRIVQLQQMLVQQFSGAVSKLEAESTTLRQMLMNLPQGAVSEEVNLLIDEVAEAWTLLREHLKNFTFVGHSLPAKCCELEINMNTPLVMLLPSWRGQGLCSMAMVYFLCAVQNHFLDGYAEIMNIQLPEPVSIQSASVADVISFHPDRELLPLVVAGCNYSVTKEKGLTYNYDLEIIAREVRERFVRGRSKLLPMVQTVLFREDFTDAGRFTALNEKVPQERLPLSLHQQICSETSQMLPLTKSLAALEVAVGFLVSVGGDPNTTLGDFMLKTLQMKTALHSDRAMQHCTVSQVKHLWLVLSHERAKLQAKYGQDPFDHVSPSYCEHIPGELKGPLREALHRTNVSMLMDGLYEYILLGVRDRGQPVHRQTDGEDTDDTEYPLGYTLDAFLESSDGDSLPILTDSQRFPDQLLVKHAVSTWMEAFRYQKTEGKK